MNRFAGMLAGHLAKAGLFSPFTYSIGLEESIEDSLHSLEEYPLQDPDDEATLASFGRSLAFVHEATHLTQFLSSAAGLRTMRFTLICLYYLSRRKGWRLPILEDFYRRRETLDDFETQAFDRFVSFFDVADQLRIHACRLPSQEALERGVGVRLASEPWSPHFFLLPPEAAAGERLAYADHLRKAGALVKQLPHVQIQRGGVIEDVVLNTAALMESFAVIAEVNHLSNAFGNINLEEVSRVVPGGAEYWAAILLGIEAGCCTAENLMPVAICIDLSLMYDAFILFNAPVLERPKDDGVPDRYPGEIFIEAVRTAAKIGAMQADCDAGRFYKELCERMKIPSPRRMAEKAYEVAGSLLSRVPGGARAFLGEAIRAHHGALKCRLADPESYPIRLLRRDGLGEILLPMRSFVSFYDLQNRKPFRFDCRQVDVVSLHNLLLQMLSSQRIDCPLKNGNPFYCEASVLPANQLCKWIGDSWTSECQVDILEKQLGIISGVKA
jgi:hypothetical protein